MNNYLFQLDNVNVLLRTVSLEKPAGIKYFPRVQNTTNGKNSVNVSIDPIMYALYYVK